MAVSLLILNRFSNIFTVRFSSKFAAKCLLKISPHLICVAIVPSETKHWWQKMSDRRNAAINDKLLCTVVTYLNCGRIVNNQILKKDSLLSLTIKKSKSANGIVTDKKVDCVVHFLQYLAVCGYTKCIRDNHLLACNYAKDLPILIFFHC